MSAPRPAVLVLAGSRAGPDPVAEAGGRSCKAFVQIGGRPMLERVIAALEASGCVGDISVALDAAAPTDVEAPALAKRMAAGEISRADPARTPSRSVLQAFDALPAGTPLIVTTADHPLLTAQMVAEFVRKAVDSGAEAAAALAPTELIDATYPDARRTRLKFRDGGYSGCNLFCFRGAGARNVLTFWGRMEARRKRPWRLAMALGPLTLVAYALGLLTLKGALRRLGRKAGADLHAVILPQAEAAIDVDKLEDLRLVERILGAGDAGQLAG
ncbi:nucleotidyltransferase family protein [Ferruginivarius sediminum]|uniref:nucleotidyltransferase family protein n=1 Tax=Ferruginivarius sediminum TaxID=2661937 RepID=UPI001379A8A5|nr:nucleotidyltransferase family protein [Ferruginivarius sediminum]